VRTERPGVLPAPGFDGEVEETWLPSAGGAMLGTFRLIAKERVSFYELMTIEDRLDGPVMLLKHFDPDLSSWEEKHETNVWPGEPVEDGFARFGPVEYERTGEDSLTTRVEVENGGEITRHELTFRRARPEDARRDRRGPRGRPWGHRTTP